MLKTPYSSVVYFWYLLFKFIHESSSVDSSTHVKCCPTSRGTEFRTAQCNISAADPTGMNASLQKGIDCLTTCLKNSQCQTYEYNSSKCWLGYKIFPDCFTFWVICWSHSIFCCLLISLFFVVVVQLWNIFCTVFFLLNMICSFVSFGVCLLLLQCVFVLLFICSLVESRALLFFSSFVHWIIVPLFIVRSCERMFDLHILFLL